MRVEISISRDELYQALARTTAYLGAKQADSTAQSSERITLNRGDDALLDRLWQECREPLVQTLRHRIVDEADTDGCYKLGLNLSESSEAGIQLKLQQAVANYYIQALAARWLAITDRAAAEEYRAAAATTLDSIGRQACSKRAPRRPTY